MRNSVTAYHLPGSTPFATSPTYLDLVPRAVLWLAAEVPDQVVGSVPSPGYAEFPYVLTWQMPLGARVQMLVPLGPDLATMPTAYRAVDLPDSLGLPSSGQPAAAAVPSGDAEVLTAVDITELEVAATLRERPWSALVQAATRCWRSWDGAGAPPLPAAAARLDLRAEVVLALGALALQAREEIGGVIVRTPAGLGVGAGPFLILPEDEFAEHIRAPFADPATAGRAGMRAMLGPLEDPTKVGEMVDHALEAITARMRAVSRESAAQRAAWDRLLATVRAGDDASAAVHAEQAAEPSPGTLDEEGAFPGLMRSMFAAAEAFVAPEGADGTEPHQADVVDLQALADTLAATFGPPAAEALGAAVRLGVELFDTGHDDELIAWVTARFPAQHVNDDDLPEQALLDIAARYDLNPADMVFTTAHVVVALERLAAGA